MQCRSGNGHAADSHRLKDGNWSYGAGPSYLQLNVFNLSSSLLGREFKGTNPPWTFANYPQLLEKRVIINYRHYPVNLEGQTIPLSSHSLPKIKYIGQVLALFTRISLKPQIF